jgi:hypothetical protein
MKTETKKMYRPVLERIVMAHFNNELIAYVNTGIEPGMASRTRSAFHLRAQVGRVAITRLH